MPSSIKHGCKIKIKKKLDVKYNLSQICELWNSGFWVLSMSSEPLAESKGVNVATEQVN